MSIALTNAQRVVLKTPDSDGEVAIVDGGTGGDTVAEAQANLQVDPAGTALIMAIALG